MNQVLNVILHFWLYSFYPIFLIHFFIFCVIYVFQNKFLVQDNITGRQKKNYLVTNYKQKMKLKNCINPYASFQPDTYVSGLRIECGHRWSQGTTSNFLLTSPPALVADTPIEKTIYQGPGSGRSQGQFLNYTYIAGKKIVKLIKTITCTGTLYR